MPSVSAAQGPAQPKGPVEGGLACTAGLRAGQKGKVKVVGDGAVRRQGPEQVIDTAWNVCRTNRSNAMHGAESGLGLPS